MTKAKSNLKTDKFSLLDESKKFSDRRFYDSFFVNEYGKLEHARSERYGVPFSILILHVDSFDNGKTAPAKQQLSEFRGQVVSTPR